MFTASFKRPAVSATDLVAGFLILALGSGLMPVFADPGSGWHLLTGRLILSGGIPALDQFLSPPISAPWINDQWLGDLLFGLVESALGLPGVFVFVIGICALSFLVVLRRLIEGRTTSLTISVIIFLLACLTASVQFICRPLIFSLLLLTLLHAMLLKDLTRPRLLHAKYLLGMPIIFVLWANLHGAFTLGLLQLALFFAHRLFSTFRQPTEFKANFFVAILSIALSTAATLINPWGIALWWNILGLAGSSYFMGLNSEWLPLDFFSSIFLAPLLLIVALAFSPRPIGYLKNYFYEIFSSAFLIFLLLVHRRYIVFLPIVVAPFIAGLLQAGLTAIKGQGIRGAWGRLFLADQRLSERYGASSRASTVTVVASIVILFATFGGYNSAAIRFTASYPIKIVERLAEKTRAATIFATPDLGGFLTYNLWPLYRVYIDDRNQLIGEDRYKSFFRIINISNGWREALESTGADYLILGADSPLAKLLEKRELGWMVELKDNSSKNILFKRRDPDA